MGEGFGGKGVGLGVGAGFVAPVSGLALESALVLVEELHR